MNFSDFDNSLTLHTTALSYAGCYGEAVELAEKLMPDREDVGDMVCLSMLHFAKSLCSEAVGDTEMALTHLNKSSETFAKMGFPGAEVMELFAAVLNLGRGQLDQAAQVRDKFENRALGGHPEAAHFWSILASVSWYLEGEIDKAEAHAHKSLAEAGASWVGIDPSLDLLAAVAIADESYVEAARLLAGASAYRERIGLRWDFKVFRDIRNHSLAMIKEALSPKDFEQAWREGLAMSIQETISYARRGRGERKRPPTGWRSLTPTEQQVVSLLAEGLSNKEVADKMFVSVRTVTTHLTHIYTKLGVGSRTELVALATKR